MKWCETNFLFKCEAPFNAFNLQKERKQDALKASNAKKGSVIVRDSGDAIYFNCTKEYIVIIDEVLFLMNALH